jgi:hypothetical protein
MKPIGVISSTALFLLLGITAPANARQEKQEEKAKPAKQEQQAKPEKQQQAKGQQDQQRQPRQQQDKPAKPQQQQQAKGQQDQQRQPRQQQDKPAKQQQQQQAKGQQDQQRQPQQQAASSQRPQRTQQEEARQRAQPAFRLSARGSGRIPDQRFRSNFGLEHRFRIGNPVFVDGYSRFQYGGYWFGFVEPWPAGWYYTDDVYIDYADGGYYMYDPYYPGARFAITVVI